MAEITELLTRWRDGNPEALERLMVLVIDDLRAMADRQLRRERASHTLQPTALVNEAFLRLVDQRVEWKDRSHFFAIAAQAMRRVLVDHARRREAMKRQTPEPPVEVVVEDTSVDVLALDRALDELTSLDAQQAKIVELRYFGGLTNEEVAAALDVSLATVKRDWASARAYLYRALHRV